MPGASVSTDFGPEDTNAWVFTYTSRLAWYPPPDLVPGRRSGGRGGQGHVAGGIPRWPRWEPNPHAVFALTYDAEFKGGDGAGWEIGMMLFTPPFFQIGPRK